MDPIRQLLEISANYTIYREKKAANPDLITKEESELELERLTVMYAEALTRATVAPGQSPKRSSEQDRLAKEIHGMAYGECGDEERSAVDMEIANPGTVLPARGEPTV